MGLATRSAGSVRQPASAGFNCGSKRFPGLIGSSGLTFRRLMPPLPQTRRYFGVIGFSDCEQISLRGHANMPHSVADSSGRHSSTSEFSSSTSSASNSAMLGAHLTTILNPKTEPCWRQEEPEKSPRGGSRVTRWVWTDILFGNSQLPINFAEFVGTVSMETGLQHPATSRPTRALL